MGHGLFYRLQSTDGATARIPTGAPEVLWLAQPPEAAGADGGECLLQGVPIDGGGALPLVSISPEGALQVHFDVAATAEAILREQYHGGMRPSLEMRLPFNYSRLPNWMKQAARAALACLPQRAPLVAFPPPPPVYVVEWLRKLARLAGQPADSLGACAAWPEGCRAAFTITHDVDTDWLFRHPDWLERLCDLEEAHGFRGAFYCVPEYSRGKAAERGIRRLLDRGCEVGVHGYNHDAQWPLMAAREFDRRAAVVRAFAGNWEAKGFRSEWLYRTPRFLEMLAEIFAYDSSVPAWMRGFTAPSDSGCGSCFPYRTFGNLLEIPLSLPMDEWRRAEGLSAESFWQRQVEYAGQVVEWGGAAVFSLHPQPHQAANTPTLRALGKALGAMAQWPRIWRARPRDIAAWVSTPAVAVP